MLQITGLLVAVTALMIGPYICTRMLSDLLRSKPFEEALLVKFMAVGVMIWTLMGMSLVFILSIALVRTAA